MSSTYGFRVLEAEIRRTKRALWLARAERARAFIHCIAYMYDNTYDLKKWQWVERKCRAKAEEYR